VDLDGDGRDETVSATSERGAVRLAVRGPEGVVLASGKAPAPTADVVHVALTAGSLGSAGALLEVSAATDASACVSIWRFRYGHLSRLAIHDGHGKDLPDCERTGQWTYRFENEGEGRPAELVRERTERSPQGTLRVREAFAFTGFSLDADPPRSSREIEGVPIPAWPDDVYYSTAALEILYGRFDLSRMRAEPTLRIHADRDRGVFALELSQGASSVTAPVASYAARGREIDLGAKVGDQTARLTVSLGGELLRPVEVRVGGLGAPYEGQYGPAGTLHGRGGARVFASAADELAVQELDGTWLDPSGGHWPTILDGSPPYRLRVGNDLYDIDLVRAEKPADLVLRPVAAGRSWGIVLRGRNVIERIPVVCPASPDGSASPAPPCRADGPPERMRRLGARANAQ
jgi:hypothetical protein